MSPERTPAVLMLDAFSRDPALTSTEQLAYPELERVAGEARQKEMTLLNEFWAAEAGSVQEEDRARAAAVGYFVLTGQQMQRTSPDRQPIVASRFTEASIELYGTPNETDFQALAQEGVEEFENYQQNPNVDQERLNSVLTVLRSRAAVSEGTTSSAERRERFFDAARRLATALTTEYSDVLAVFNDLDPKQSLSSSEVAELYEKGLEILKTRDDAWGEWATKLVGKAGLATDDVAKEVQIGDQRKPMKPAKAMQLFCHEVLIHGLRSVNGGKTGEPMLEHGLPNFLDAEEGLAVFIEYGLTGTVPAIRNDRYVDFGLVLGLADNQPLSRRELQQYYVDRAVVRKQAKGEAVDLEAINGAGWRYVNRIFRGAPEQVQAVNTKDLAYANGFIKMGNYVAEALDSGVTETDLLKILLAGKYDPTNQKHVAFVSRFVR